jgi:hypothetical protein
MNEIKVTWGLVWAIWWRFTLISLGVCVIVSLIWIIIAFAMGSSFVPW